MLRRHLILNGEKCYVNVANSTSSINVSVRSKDLIHYFNIKSKDTYANEIHFYNTVADFCLIKHTLIKPTCIYDGVSYYQFGDVGFYTTFSQGPLLIREGLSPWSFFDFIQLIATANHAELLNVYSYLSYDTTPLIGWKCPQPRWYCQNCKQCRIAITYNGLIILNIWERSKNYVKACNALGVYMSLTPDDVDLNGFIDFEAYTAAAHDLSIQLLPLFRTITSVWNLGPAISTHKVYKSDVACSYDYFFANHTYDQLDSHVITFQAFKDYWLVDIFAGIEIKPGIADNDFSYDGIIDIRYILSNMNYISMYHTFWLGANFIPINGKVYVPCVGLMPSIPLSKCTNCNLTEEAIALHEFSSTDLVINSGSVMIDHSINFSLVTSDVVELTQTRANDASLNQELMKVLDPYVTFDPAETDKILLSAIVYDHGPSALDKDLMGYGKYSGESIPSSLMHIAYALVNHMHKTYTLAESDFQLTLLENQHLRKRGASAGYPFNTIAVNAGVYDEVFGPERQTLLEHSMHSVTQNFVNGIVKFGVSEKANGRSISAMPKVYTELGRFLFQGFRDCIKKVSTDCPIKIGVSNSGDTYDRLYKNIKPHPHPFTTDHSQFDRVISNLLQFMYNAQVFEHCNDSDISDPELLHMLINEHYNACIGLIKAGDKYYIKPGGVASGNCKTADGNSHSNAMLYFMAICEIIISNEILGDKIIGAADNYVTDTLCKAIYYYTDKEVIDLVQDGVFVPALYEYIENNICSFIILSDDLSGRSIIEDIGLVFRGLFYKYTGAILKHAPIFEFTSKHLASYSDGNSIRHIPEPRPEKILSGLLYISKQSNLTKSVMIAKIMAALGELTPAYIVEPLNSPLRNIFDKLMNFGQHNIGQFKDIDINVVMDELGFWGEMFSNDMSDWFLPERYANLYDFDNLDPCNIVNRAMIQGGRAMYCSFCTAVTKFSCAHCNMYFCNDTNSHILEHSCGKIKAVKYDSTLIKCEFCNVCDITALYRHTSDKFYCLDHIVDQPRCIRLVTPQASSINFRYTSTVIAPIAYKVFEDFLKHIDDNARCYSLISKNQELARLYFRTIAKNDLTKIIRDDYYDFTKSSDGLIRINSRYRYNKTDSFFINDVKYDLVRIQQNNENVYQAEPEIMLSKGKFRVSHFTQIITADLEELNKSVVPDVVLSMVGCKQQALIHPHIISKTDYFDDKTYFSIFDSVRTKAYTIVKGPPGSGKTYFVAQLVNCFRAGHRIVCVAMSHCAVDELYHAIVKMVGRDVRSLVKRYIPQTYVSFEHYNTYQEGGDYFALCMTTASSCNVGKVDLLIFDESSMLKDYNIVSVIQRIKPLGVLFVGDDKQRPPIYDGYKPPAFANIVNYLMSNAVPNPSVIILTAQHRMTKTLANRCASLFYDNKFGSDKPDIIDPIRVTIIKDRKKLLNDIVGRYNLYTNDGYNVGVICNYNSDLLWFGSNAKHVKRYTVDSSQGQTYDFVILLASNTEFANVPNRINVAVSRGKFCLHVYNDRTITGLLGTYLEPGYATYDPLLSLQNFDSNVCPKCNSAFKGIDKYCSICSGKGSYDDWINVNGYDLVKCFDIRPVYAAYMSGRNRCYCSELNKCANCKRYCVSVTNSICVYCEHNIYFGEWFYHSDVYGNTHVDVKPHSLRDVIAIDFECAMYKHKNRPISVGCYSKFCDTEIFGYPTDDNGQRVSFNLVSMYIGGVRDNNAKSYIQKRSKRNFNIEMRELVKSLACIVNYRPYFIVWSKYMEKACLDPFCYYGEYKCECGEDAFFMQAGNIPSCRSCLDEAVAFINPVIYDVQCDYFKNGSIKQSLSNVFKQFFPNLDVIAHRAADDAKMTYMLYMGTNPAFDTTHRKSHFSDPHHTRCSNYIKSYLRSVINKPVFDMGSCNTTGLPENSKCCDIRNGVDMNDIVPCEIPELYINSHYYLNKFVHNDNVIIHGHCPDFAHMHSCYKGKHVYTHPIYPINHYFKGYNVVDLVNVITDKRFLSCSNYLSKHGIRTLYLYKNYDSTLFKPKFTHVLQTDTPTSDTVIDEELLNSLKSIEAHHFKPDGTWCPAYVSKRANGGKQLLHHKCRKCRKIALHLSYTNGRRICYVCLGYTMPAWYIHESCNTCVNQIQNFVAFDGTTLSVEADPFEVDFEKYSERSKIGTRAKAMNILAILRSYPCYGGNLLLLGAIGLNGENPMFGIFTKHWQVDCYDIKPGKNSIVCDIRDLSVDKLYSVIVSDIWSDNTDVFVHFLRLSISNLITGGTLVIKITSKFNNFDVLDTISYLFEFTNMYKYQGTDSTSEVVIVYNGFGTKPVFNVSIGRLYYGLMSCLIKCKTKTDFVRYCYSNKQRGPFRLLTNKGQSLTDDSFIKERSLYFLDSVNPDYDIDDCGDWPKTSKFNHYCTGCGRWAHRLNHPVQKFRNKCYACCNRKYPNNYFKS